MSESSRPKKVPNHLLDLLVSDLDGADDSPFLSTLAFAEKSAALVTSHETSEAGVATLARIRAFVEQEGVAALESVWGHSPAVSRPGALWRLFLMGHHVEKRSDVIGALVERGVVDLQTVDPVIAAVREPIDAARVSEVVDEILEWAFTGRLADAAERGAALARIVSAGLLHWPSEPDDAHQTVLSALHWEELARVLAEFARREKSGQLR